MTQDKKNRHFPRYFMPYFPLKKYTIFPILGCNFPEKKSGEKKYTSKENLDEIWLEKTCFSSLKNRCNFLKKSFTK